MVSRDHGQQERRCPRGPGQQAAKPGPHTHGVAQGVHDGHTAIIGHGGQQETLHDTQIEPTAIWAKHCPSKMAGTVTKQLMRIWGTLDVV